MYMECTAALTLFHHALSRDRVRSRHLRQTVLQATAVSASYGDTVRSKGLVYFPIYAMCRTNQADTVHAQYRPACGRVIA